MSNTWTRCIRCNEMLAWNTGQNAWLTSVGKKECGPENIHMPSPFSETDVWIERARLDAAVLAWARLLNGVGHLRMDTPEDQQRHDELVKLACAALAPLQAALWAGKSSPG